jgi:hypothetical protein
MKYRLAEGARRSKETLYLCRGNIDCSLVRSLRRDSRVSLRIFVTFIHEGGHAIAARLTETRLGVSAFRQ